MGTSGTTSDNPLIVTNEDGIAALDQLEERHRDWLTPLAKGVVGACPLIGPMLAEVVGMVVPNQRVERILAFLRTFDERLAHAEARIECVRRHLRTAEGVDLLEESMTQATRAVTTQRQERLGRLLATALTQDELRYEEAKKLLGLLRELTDPELLWLVYHSIPPTFSSAFHERLFETHPEVFEPASATLNAPDDELDRAALQESYKHTLERYGLLERQGRQQFQITRLGQMLLRYVDAGDQPSAEG